VSKIVKNGESWMKAEMHAHCSLDPEDYKLCRHSPEQLISEAADLGYAILSITCHNEDVWSLDLAEFAESKGVVLIPGMEVDVEGRYHVLTYNFHTGSENLNTFDKIRSLSNEDTLVIAPHAYFPGITCLRSRLERNLDVFDAIERSGFYVRGLDFNRSACNIAAKHDKPIIGNGDVHMLWQLGKTFTWIYTKPGIAETLKAIKRGLVRVESNPLPWGQAVQWWATAFWRVASWYDLQHRPLRSGA